MEYERLTFRHKSVVDGTEQIGYTEKLIPCFNKQAMILNRLAELEDKIEQGTLIELPCKVGDTVYVIATCSDVDMYRIYEENRYDCPFEYDCDYEDCDRERATLRIFDTKVIGIYSSVGIKGFFVEF